MTLHIAKSERIILQVVDFSFKLLISRVSLYPAHCCLKIKVIFFFSITRNQSLAWKGIQVPAAQASSSGIKKGEIILVIKTE